MERTHKREADVKNNSRQNVHPFLLFLVCTNMRRSVILSKEFKEAMHRSLLERMADYVVILYTNMKASINS